MKKIIFVMTVAIAAVCSFTGCEKEEIAKSVNESDFEWDSTCWVSKSFCQYIMDMTEADDDAEILPKILENWNTMLLLNSTNIPESIELSDNELYFYNRIHLILDKCALGSIAFEKQLDSLQFDDYYVLLNRDEKIRVSVMAHAYMGVSAAINQIANYSKQPPRTSYNNANGDSQLERRISSCMSYQIDGHFETRIGAAVYIAGMPTSLLWDYAQCGEEIARGYWNHVH